MDIHSGSAIANVFAALCSEFAMLKEVGVNLDPEGKFGAMLKSVAKVSSDKPLLLTYIDKITKVMLG